MQNNVKTITLRLEEEEGKNGLKALNSLLKLWSFI